MLTQNQSVVTSELLNSLFGLDVEFTPFNGLGDTTSNHASRILTYTRDIQYVSTINSNEHIAGVICGPDIADAISDRIQKIVHPDPTYAFFTLVDHFGKKVGHGAATHSETPLPKDHISIAACDVYIGKNVLIEPNVVILPGVIIQDNVVLRAGAVIGLDTFQHQRTSMGMVSPKHDGYLTLAANVEVGANSTICRGFSYRGTCIGEGTKLDAQVYIAHGVSIGKENIICAGARIMGHTTIGDYNFIGPGSVISNRLTIGDRNKVSLGAVVTKDISERERVTGNFAVPHDEFMRKLKQ